MYELIPKDKIKVLHVFAPYSQIISEFGRESRRPLWERELNSVMQNVFKQEADVINLERLLDGPDNGKYCFDLIHLNQQGKEKFSNELGDILFKRIKENKL
jgi:sugar phosphate isomerase/epimerase